MQRAVIVLRAKNVEFDVTYINLRDKPDWFLKISPHGKVPVLSVNDEPLFESNAIAEYLDETTSPRLHPVDDIKRARNRAWTDFVPDFSRQMSAITYAKTREDLAAALDNPPVGLQRLEDAIANERSGDGPYFNDDQLCLVDASYAPFFMRFAFAERYLQTGLLSSYPLVSAWADALLENDSVVGSVAPEFDEVFADNLARRDTYAATLMSS